MADPKLSPTCYLDVSELADFVGGIAQADWPTARRFLQAAARTVDERTHRFFFQLEATAVDMNVLPGQKDFFPPYDLLAAPTGLKLDVDADLTYSEDLIADGAVLVPLGTIAPFYGFQVREIGLAIHGTKPLRVTANWGWPRNSELVSGQTVQDNPLSATATTLTVQDATKFQVGQTLTLESAALGKEQVFVNDRPTATTLTIVRGINGTTAASHVLGSAIHRLLWPSGIYLVVGALASRAWRKRDVGFAGVYSDQQPRLPAGVLLDDDDLARLGPFMRGGPG